MSLAPQAMELMKYRAVLVGELAFGRFPPFQKCREMQGGVISRKACLNDSGGLKSAKAKRLGTMRDGETENVHCSHW